jgi:hypothetical protein
MLKPRPMNGRWKQLRAEAAAKAAPVEAVVEAVEKPDVMTATDDKAEPLHGPVAEEKSWFKKLTA